MVYLKISHQSGLTPLPHGECDGYNANQVFTKIYSISTSSSHCTKMKPQWGRCHLVLVTSFDTSQGLNHRPLVAGYSIGHILVNFSNKKNQISPPTIHNLCSTFYYHCKLHKMLLTSFRNTDFSGRTWTHLMNLVNSLCSCEGKVMFLQELKSTMNVILFPNTQSLKGRGEILCRPREAKSKTNRGCLRFCLTITLKDNSWEASGHTPYHIDFSSKRLLCADGGMEEGEQGRGGGGGVADGNDEGGWGKETERCDWRREWGGGQQSNDAQGRDWVKRVDVFQSHKCSNLSWWVQGDGDGTDILCGNVPVLLLLSDAAHTLHWELISDGSICSV